MIKQKIIKQLYKDNKPISFWHDIPYKNDRNSEIF